MNPAEDEPFSNSDPPISASNLAPGKHDSVPVNATFETPAPKAPDAQAAPVKLPETASSPLDVGTGVTQTKITSYRIEKKFLLAGLIWL